MAIQSPLQGIDKYMTPGTFTFPSPFVAPDEKTSSWYRANCEALFSLYVRDLTGIPYSRVNDYLLYRLYAQGMQPTVKYMDTLSPIDEASVDEREENKWKAWANETTGLKQVDEILTGQPQQDPIMSTISSVEELNMYSDIGGFKNIEEIAVEKFLDYTFEISNWRETKNSLFEDLFDIGVAACHDFVDKKDGMVKAEYIDVAKLIVRYSRNKTFNNIDRWGHWKEVTIADLRELAPEITEEELYQIAVQYKGIYGNPDKLMGDYDY